MYIIEIQTNLINLFYKHYDVSANEISTNRYIYPGMTNFKMISAIQRHKKKIDLILKTQFKIYFNKPWGFIKKDDDIIIYRKEWNVAVERIALSNFNIESFIREVDSISNIFYDFNDVDLKDIKFRKRKTQNFCRICGLAISGLPHLSVLNVCAFCIQKLGQDAEVEINNHFSKEEIIEIKKQKLIYTIGG